MHNAKEAPSPRRATSGKLKRDAENLRTYARFVIVLGESDRIEVIDNGARRVQGLPYAKLISVLGSVGNLLEIGYSRARPYADTELSNGKGSRSHQRLFLKQRPRVWLLSEELLARVYPHLVDCMVAIVREIRAGWKTKGTWYVKKRQGYTKGPGEVEFGIYFTVHHSDRSLHRQFILEDARHRKEKYISLHAKFIRSLLREYRFLYYTPRQLKSFAKARRIAGLLSQAHYTPFYRMVLCRHFEEGSRERALLDSIVKTFNIDVSITEQEAHALKFASISLPEFVNLRCYRIPQQPAVHARGATVFEIFLEKEYRLSFERSCREQTDDDEVPF